MALSPKLLQQSIIINLEDEDSDAESEVFASDSCKATMLPADLVTEQLEALHIRTQEEKLLQDICRDAMTYMQGPIHEEMYVATDACEHAKSNVIHDLADFDKFQLRITKTYALKNVKCIIIPFYESYVNFASLRWMRVPINLQATALEELRILGPAKWILTDYTLLLNTFMVDLSQPSYDDFFRQIYETEIIRLAKELGQRHLETWMLKINKLLTGVSCLYNINIQGFYLLEIAYLKDSFLNKGVCGLSLLYCEHTNEMRVRVLDLASIKLSTNHRNNAYGNFFELLLRRKDLPIYVYAPQNCLADAIFKTNCFPWSAIMMAQYKRLINLISYMYVRSNMEKNGEAVKTFCPDVLSHSDACSHCNVLNLLFNITDEERNNLRANSPSEHYVFKQTGSPDTLLSVPLPLIKKCKHITYLTYGYNPTAIIYKNCFCHK